MHLHLLRTPEEPLHLVERAGGNEHLFPGPHQRTLRQIAHRESVGVRRRQFHTIVVGRDQDTGEDHATLIGARCSHHLAQRVGHLRGRHGERLGGRLTEGWVVGQSQRPHRELTALGSDHHLVVGELDFDASSRQGLHDVRRQSSRDHHGSGRVGPHGDRGADGQLQIGTRRRQSAVGDIKAHTRQHR